MRIAVIGATGRTGARVVEQALDRGHQVTAIARRHGSFQARHENLAVVAADVLESERLVAAIAGCEAIVSAVGIGSSRAPTVVYSDGTANVLRAMATNGVRKLVAISAAPVGPRAEQPFLERRLLMPVLDRVFGATYDDMRRMEEILRESDLDWVVLRPPRLVDKPARGSYRLALDGRLQKARSITYADLASALINALDRADLYRQMAFIAN